MQPLCLYFCCLPRYHLRSLSSFSLSPAISPLFYVLCLSTSAYECVALVLFPYESLRWLIGGTYLLTHFGYQVVQKWWSNRSFFSLYLVPNLLAFVSSDNNMFNLYFSFPLVIYTAKIRKYTGFSPLFGREKSLASFRKRKERISFVWLY